MEFVIDSDSLAKGLYRAQGIVERRTAMPILSNVLFETGGDYVKLTATDLEVGMTCQHPAEIRQSGSLSVNARYLYEIVRGLKNQPVSIKKLENNWVQVTCGSNEYKLLGMAAEDFQQLPDISDVELVEVEGEDLRQMIEKTSFAVSTDEARYNLNGSFLEKIDGKYRMTATDGHRLAMVEKGMARESSGPALKDGILIPRKGLVEMRRILESEEGIVKIGHQGNNFVFFQAEVMVVMRLLEGQFPDYRQVVPGEQKVKVTLSRKELMDSLRRVSVFSANKNLGLKIIIGDNRLLVTSSNPDKGEAREKIDVEYGGDELTVGFNAKYLIDALSAMSEEEVRVSLEDDTSPGVFKPVGDDSYTCIIMPMRI